MLQIIASIGSAIVSTVSSAVSTIGPAVSSFCTNVLPKLAPMFEKGIEAIKTVSNIAQAVLQVLGIFKSDEKIDDIGDRALQAAEEGITPDKFKNFDQYLESIRTLELNPEKSATTSLEAKFAAGLAISAKGLEHKFNAPEGMMSNLWLLAACDPKFFNAERLGSILEKTADIASVMRYFNGVLDLPEARSVEKTLVEAENKLSPQKTNDAIYADLDKASEAVRRAEN